MPAPDYTEMFNTKLDKTEEQAFEQWLEESGRHGDLYDYDLRGAFKAGKIKPGHLPDTYKKPNHPTFSTESQYSNEKTPGGDWVQQGDKWVYKPSPLNLDMHGTRGLADYFKQVEPDVELILPQMVQ